MRLVAILCLAITVWCQVTDGLHHRTKRIRREAANESVISKKSIESSMDPVPESEKSGRGLSVLSSLHGSYPEDSHYPATSLSSHNHHQSHGSGSTFDWTKNGHDVPQFISDANNSNQRINSLIDRAVVRAPWNLLTAKLFRLVAVFFLESYLVQLFGVSLPID